MPSGRQILAASRNIKKTIDRMQTQWRDTGGIDQKQQMRLRNNSKEGIATIIQVALRGYVDCFASSDGMTPLMPSLCDSNYLIHNSDSAIGYPHTNWPWQS
jgi:hypothetical protein